MSKQLHLFQHTSFPISQIIKRDGRVVAFDASKITHAIYKSAVSVGGRDLDLAEKLTQKVLKNLRQSAVKDSIPTVEEVQDLIEKILIEAGHAKTAKAFILYRAERSRMRDQKASAVSVEDYVPYKLVWKAYSWNVDHACDSVEKLNRQMRDGSWKKLVEASEKQYHAEIKKVVEHMLKKQKDIRIMIVAGPSSSGKTTTTIKISEILAAHGISFLTMNMDNYFKNLDMHPKDEYNDYDFEGPQALDLELINRHLSDLVKGKTIHMPHYDFKLGIRTKKTYELKLRPGQIALVDSLHGLYEGMTHSVEPQHKFKFYIEALCQIKDLEGEFVRWTDVRMLRRMNRDRLHRNYDPARTVGHWHYVRRGEKQFIVPHIKNADYVFNGSSPYELPVYKNFLENLFPEIIRAFEDDPKKIDAYLRAQRVARLLQSLENFPDVEAIPKNSFIREFIGGSSYQY